MTTDELEELFLYRLYEHHEGNDYATGLGLDPVAAEFGVVDRMKVINVADALVAKGWVKAIHTGGGSEAWLTAEGSRLVERGGETGIIPKYTSNPGQVLLVDQST